MMIFDLVHQTWLGPVLGQRVATKILIKKQVFQCSRSGFGRVWKLAIQRLGGFAKLGPTDLYRVRH